MLIAVLKTVRRLGCDAEFMKLLQDIMEKRAFMLAVLNTAVMFCST